MSFDSLGLSPVLLRALADQKYNAPTAIQAAAIPVALSGRDMLAGAQTGTGKTAAFVLPLLERLFAGDRAPNNSKRRPRALILTPTRELAAQVHESLRTYARYLKIFSTTIYGGMSMGPQMDALRRGVDVLVATPGRLMDHMERRTVDLSGIEILVLDEADRMLDMGFLPAITRILGSLPKQRQTLLFSATFADEIKRLAQQFMRDPAEIQVAARNSIASTITHRVHPVDAANKRDLLLHILAQDSRRQTLVFSRTKHGADKLCKFLDQSGLRSAAIHGNKTQGARTRALKEFKTGKVTVLVATDIAARGLDIDQLPVVINYDLPMVAEDYIHRIGRTGRAGAEGLAVSLVAHDEARLLRDIRRLLKQEIAIANVEGYEPSRPLNLESNAAKPGQNGKPRNPNHARRPHTHNPNNKGHAAAKKQHREWRGSRNARKA